MGRLDTKPGRTKSPSVIDVLSVQGAWLDPGLVAYEAVGLQPLSATSFTLGVIVEIPPGGKNETYPLFYLGDFPGRHPKGLELRWHNRDNDPDLQLKVGNGTDLNFSSWISIDEGPGTYLFLLYWNGEQRKLDVALNDRSLGEFTIPVSDLPSSLRQAMVLFGMRPTPQDLVEKPSGMVIHRAFVLDGQPSPVSIYAQYAERIQNWNQ
jgi:hypothetical protein